MSIPTKDEILAELDSLIEKYPQKEENDITVKDIMESRGVGHSSASEIMRKIAKLNSDKYDMIKVRCGTSGWQWALRKKP